MDALRDAAAQRGCGRWRGAEGGLVGVDEEEGDEEGEEGEGRDDELRGCQWPDCGARGRRGLCWLAQPMDWPGCRRGVGDGTIRTFARRDSLFCSAGTVEGMRGGGDGIATNRL